MSEQVGMRLASAEVVPVMGRLMVAAGRALETRSANLVLDVAVQGSELARNGQGVSLATQDAEQVITTSLRVDSGGLVHADSAVSYPRQNRGRSRGTFAMGPRGRTEYQGLERHGDGTIATLDHPYELPISELAVMAETAVDGSTRRGSRLPWALYGDERSDHLLVRANRLIPALGPLLRVVGDAVTTPATDRELTATARLNLGTPGTLYEMGRQNQGVTLRVSTPTTGVQAEFSVAFMGGNQNANMTYVRAEVRTERTDQEGRRIARNERLVQQGDTTYALVRQQVSNGAPGPVEVLRYGPAGTDPLVALAQRALSGQMIPEYVFNR